MRVNFIKIKEIFIKYLILIFIGGPLILSRSVFLKVSHLELQSSVGQVFREQW
jgi:hypothetical protein